MRPHRHHVGAAIALGAFALACGAPKTQTPAPTGSGQLAVSLVDAKSDSASQVWITVTRVTAHADGGGWFDVTTVPSKLPLTFDLLKLQDSATDLGLATLPKGTTITQIRLYVSGEDGKNWVVLSDGTTTKPLKVPSGVQSGIKIHGPWTIAECSQTAVTLDMDGQKSVWTHPTGLEELWILRPVVHVKKSDTVPVGCTPPSAPVPPVACDPQAPTVACTTADRPAIVCAPSSQPLISRSDEA